MQEASYKIRNYAKNYAKVTVVNNNNIRKKLLNMFLISFGSLALFYALVLGMMVFNIIERKSLEAEARVLSAQVASLELKYLDVSSKIDLNLSAQMGFVEPKSYVATRRSLGFQSPFQNYDLAKLAANEI